MEFAQLELELQNIRKFKQLNSSYIEKVAK